MFLRSIHRKKDGKDHRYFSIVETIASLPTRGAANLLYLARSTISNKRHGAKRCRF